MLVLLLLGCAIVIYLACEWFVNAIEWLGAQLRVGPAAVGTILAAIGTALPESVVTLVAVLFGSRADGNAIAVGAALGGPLVVGTLAYAVTGAMLLLRVRNPRAERSGAGVRPPALPGPDAARVAGLDETDTCRLARDQTWFLVIFAGKLGLGLVVFTGKPWLAVLFVAAYAGYFWRETRASGEIASSEGLAPLRLQPRRAQPARWAVLLQTSVALVVIFAASQLFVRQLEGVGPALGLPAVVVALLLSPVATELPEIMNAIIWVRQGKAQLALANISGAMMIQATVPSAIGIAFTPWRFGTPLVLAGVATLSCVAYLLWLMRTRRVTPRLLTGAAAFYVVFAAALLITLA